MLEIGKEQTGETFESFVDSMNGLIEALIEAVEANNCQDAKAFFEMGIDDINAGFAITAHKLVDVDSSELDHNKGDTILFDSNGEPDSYLLANPDNDDSFELFPQNLIFLGSGLYKACLDLSHDDKNDFIFGHKLSDAGDPMFVIVVKGYMFLVNIDFADENPIKYELIENNMSHLIN